MQTRLCCNEPYYTETTSGRAIYCTHCGAVKQINDPEKVKEYIYIPQPYPVYHYYYPYWQKYNQPYLPYRWQYTCGDTVNGSTTPIQYNIDSTSLPSVDTIGQVLSSSVLSQSTARSALGFNTSSAL